MRWMHGLPVRRAPEMLQATAALERGHRQAQAKLALIANPFFNRSHPESRDNPRQITVMVNVRESAILALAQRGVLAEHQLQAAVKFQRFWLNSTGWGMRSMRL